MHVPVIPLNRVLHIGTMRAEDVGSNHASSFEGNCLSVSLCPRAWERIARLGGDDLHELRTDDGLFLDMHAVMRDGEAVAALLDWAAESGLVAEREVWKLWTQDEYTRRWSFDFYPSREKAEDAARRIGGLGPDDEIRGPRKGPGIEAVTMPVATQGLQDASGLRCLPFDPKGVQITPGDHLDAVVMAWAINEVPELIGRPLDGVWWRDTYSPDRLSAPRGGIFPGRVASWSAAPIEWNGVEDRREMRAMPATTVIEAEPATGPSP